MGIKVSPTPLSWEERVAQTRWVAYSPTSADPNRGVEASEQVIRDDIALLHRAGFTGLVSYSSAGTLGRYLPDLAQSEGFVGLILGVWDPTNTEELRQAEQAADVSIVLGYSVGNEGLGTRYTIDTLASAVDSLRRSTKKPVTTTEQFDDYVDSTLLQLGDWVFPNTHPYFHNQTEPDLAAQWTRAAYDDLVRRAHRFVLLKEVGLPTAGDPKHKLSEDGQRTYYEQLSKTNVRFVYFEAYDQPWKADPPVEPHWGIFRSDRAPKLLAATLMDRYQTTTSEPSVQVLEVYRDAASAGNHFVPSGYMGDTGDIRINEAFDGSPHSGVTSIRVTYSTDGKGPNVCGTPLCRWGGAYWLEPADNWGTDPANAGRGLNLSGFDRLTFWARTDRSCRIEFKVGGISERYGDSLTIGRSIRPSLTTEWQKFDIDLSGADLSYIIGGFAWVTNWETNPDGAIFYLDDIRFEQNG